MENKEVVESIFEENSLYSRLVDSSTFDIIINQETNEKKPVISNDNQNMKVSKFVEMPLQMTANSKAKVRQPFLLLEDKRNKNESFRNYEISLIDEKNEKKIKCYRRFSNFDALNLKLRERYSFLIIPSLPKKNYKVKIIKLEEEFYSNRTRNLNSYLNYLFRHEVLSMSIEFTKFLNDAEFDEQFFSLEDVGKQFQETERSTKLSVSGQIYDYFSGFFKTKEYSRIPSQEESHLHKLNLHYSALHLKFKELKKKMKGFIDNMKNNALSYGEMASNFLYLKEVHFESFNNKEYLTKYNETMKDLYKINLRLYEEEGDVLLDKLRLFLSLLKGLIEMLQRWEEFLILYETVDKAFYLSKSHPKSFNMPILTKEYQKAMDMKSAFIKNISKEVNDFCSNNKATYTVIIDDFKNLINFINTNEKTKLTSIENYF